MQTEDLKAKNGKSGRRSFSRIFSNDIGKRNEANYFFRGGVSLVKGIKDALYKDIQRRPYLPGEKLPGIRQLADQYGVSYVTMSNALLLLAEEGIIEQHQGRGSYVTDMVAKTTIGILMPDYLLGLKSFDMQTDTTCLFGIMEIYAGLLDELNSNGFTAHLIPVRAEKHMAAEDFFDLVKNKFKASGVMFLAVGNEGIIEHFAERNFPYCLIYHKPQNKFNHVSIDLEDGAFQVTKHLISRGHKRIGMISATLQSPWFERRYSGYRKALDKYKLPCDATLVNECDSENALEAAAEELLAANPPTALFVTSDRWALFLLDFFKRKGIRVPEDIVLAGFDDFAESKVSEPTLTTVHQPFYELGQAGFRLMKEIIVNPNKKYSKLIKPSLIKRNSTNYSFK